MVKGGATMALPPTTTAAARPPGGGAYSSEASLDTNMVIILGALLCALICALGLNSIIRCALRCGHQLAGTNRHRLHGAGSTHTVGGYQGLKKSIIRQIPVVIYHNKPNDRKNDDKKNNNNNEVISTDCMICLGEFVDGEKIRVLPKCKHGFHVRCIDTWLLSHSSCPTCRQSVSGPEWVVNGQELVAMGTNGGGGGDGSHGSGSQRQVISEMV